MASIFQRLVVVSVLCTVVFVTLHQLDHQPENKTGFFKYVHPGGPPPPPPVSSTESECEPYTRPGHIHLNTTSHFDTYFASYDPTCQPSSPSWIAQIRASAANRSNISSLKNKELLILGDSIDRNIVIDLCALLGTPATVHPLHTYREAVDSKIGGYPRSCKIEHLNLTLANYFFYGYDETDMWTDKSNTYTAPGEFSRRWALFTQAIKTLPSGGSPTLVMANVGLWELARFDRLLERAGKEDPAEIYDEFRAGFKAHTVSFLHDVRGLVGNNTRIRWREMHTPGISDGNFFVDPSKGGKARARFSAVKINMLNAEAEEAIKTHSMEEGKRRHGDTQVNMWPIGRLMRPWPAAMWIRDDVHPTDKVGAIVWGEGVLEYLARAP